VPGWLIAAAVVAALVPAVWFVAQRAFDSPAAAPADSTSERPVSPDTSGTPTPQSPTTTPAAPTAPTTTASLPAVAPSAPRRLQSGTAIDTGFDAAVTTLEPASTSEVARLSSRGSPGSPGTDTVVVLGKVRAAGALAQLPALTAGTTLTIRTDAGTMTYTVSSATLRPEAALAQDPLVTQRVPGRLVLVGIRYADSGDRLRDALVVTAQLTGAEKA
jgi:hypothetical protein